MKVRVQPLRRGAERYCGAVARQGRLGHSESQCGFAGEHAQLRAGVDESVDLIAVELRWKGKVVAERFACRDRRIGLGPGRCRARAGLLAVEYHSVMRQIEIDIETAQGVRAEDPVERSGEHARHIERSDTHPAPWYRHVAGGEAAQLDL